MVNAMRYVGKNCGNFGKLWKLQKNCGKLRKIAENCGKLRKIVEIAGNCGKIAENCGNCKIAEKLRNCKKKLRTAIPQLFRFVWIYAIVLEVF